MVVFSRYTSRDMYDTLACILTGASLHSVFGNDFGIIGER